MHAIATEFHDMRRTLLRRVRATPDAPRPTAWQSFRSFLPIAIMGIAFAATLAMGSYACKVSPLSRGLFPQFELGMTMRDVCSATVMNMAGAFLIMGVGGLLLDLAQFGLSRFGWRMRKATYLTLIVALGLFAMWRYETFISDFRAYAADTTGRIEELARIHRTLKANGVTSELAPIEERMKEIAGAGK